METDKWCADQEKDLLLVKLMQERTLNNTISIVTCSWDSCGLKPAKQAIQIGQPLCIGSQLYIASSSLPSVSRFWLLVDPMTLLPGGQLSHAVIIREEELER